MKKKMRTCTDGVDDAITSGKTTLEISKTLDRELKRRAKVKACIRRRNLQKAKRLVAELIATVTEFVEK